MYEEPGDPDDESYSDESAFASNGKCGFFLQGKLLNEAAFCSNTVRQTHFHWRLNTIQKRSIMYINLNLNRQRDCFRL